MQKWEYLVIGDINYTEGGLKDYGHTRATKFGNNGCEIVKEFYELPEGVHRRDAVSQYIASLGEDGWEMVGTGSTRNDLHCIYFKRPKE